MKEHDRLTLAKTMMDRKLEGRRTSSRLPELVELVMAKPLVSAGMVAKTLEVILDDFSRYTIAWKLCTSMKVEDVTDTLDLALAASGCDKVKVEHRPRLLSDNGPCYVASDLGEWLETYKIDQVHGAPGHPQTQGKIERWHQTLKNRILLENYFFKEDLEAQIAAFIEHYNHRRYHESLDNLTPADVYFGRGQTILIERERIKRDTIKQRRLNHQAKAAQINP